MRCVCTLAYLADGALDVCHICSHMLMISSTCEKEAEGGEGSGCHESMCAAAADSHLCAAAAVVLAVVVAAGSSGRLINGSMCLGSRLSVVGVVVELERSLDGGCCCV